MLGRITLKLPILIRWGVLFPIKKNISFNFDRRAMWLFMERHEDMAYDLDKFTEYKSKNRDAFLIEYIYCAYLSWCNWNRKKPMSEKKFFISFNMWGEGNIGKLLKCWGEADSVGYKSVKSDKKKTK
jgi:hypothetical protein